jgi:hypothetical protein
MISETAWAASRTKPAGSRSLAGHRIRPPAFPETSPERYEVKKKGHDR